MVKKYRTQKASDSQVRQFKRKATQYRKAQVLNLKGLVEYDARGCTQKDAAAAIKRVERIFSWAEETLP